MSSNVTTSVIKGTSKKKLYNKFGLKYLIDRQWIQRLCLFHKIYKLISPTYLYDLISSVTRFYATRNNKYPHEYFLLYFLFNVIRGDIHTQFVTQNVKMTFSVQPTNPHLKASGVTKYFFVVN